MKRDEFGFLVGVKATVPYTFCALLMKKKKQKRMADDYDADIVQQLLEEAATQMRIKQTRFGRTITSLVSELYDLVKDEEGSSFSSQPSSGTFHPPSSIDHASRKKIISARACVVCGRDDRPGEQRSKGFKCHECVGIPSKLEAELRRRLTTRVKRSSTSLRFYIH